MIVDITIILYIPLSTLVNGMSDNVQEKKSSGNNEVVPGGSDDSDRSTHKYEELRRIAGDTLSILPVGILNVTSKVQGRICSSV